MIHMTLVLKYPHDGLLYPVLLEKDCTRVVYLLQLSALRVSLLHWGTLIRWFRIRSQVQKAESR